MIRGKTYPTRIPTGTHPQLRIDPSYTQSKVTSNDTLPNRPFNDHQTDLTSVTTFSFSDFRYPIDQNVYTPARSQVKYRNQYTPAHNEI